MQLEIRSRLEHEVAKLQGDLKAHQMDLEQKEIEVKIQELTASLPAAAGAGSQASARSPKSIGDQIRGLKGQQAAIKVKEFQEQKAQYEAEHSWDSRDVGAQPWSS